ncbi:MAG TPA: hypothetical protein VH637_17615 [Streptosporangiaceae bacterium]|jgi:hypothetical protein
MDNMYRPPASGPQDNWPTQQFGPTGGGQPEPPRGGNRALRWGAGIAVAALLAGGGAFAATTLSANSSPAAGHNSIPAANTTQDPGQAAALSTILSSASTPISASSAAPAGAATGSAAGSASQVTSAASADAAALSPSAAPTAVRTIATRCRRAASALRQHGRRRAARVVLRACRARRLVRLRALGGLHGQFTVKTKSGTATIGFARGVIESVTSSAVVVKAADGTQWTWDLVSKTVVRERGKKVGTSALKTGEQVFAGGQIVSGANDARLVVVRPAKSSAG